HCQAPHARRELQYIHVRREGETVEVEVQANAFLHHMVRNIVGSLLVVGRGDADEAWIARLLAGRDRTAAGPTAPAAGLVFLGPRYPAEWGLPADVCL
ncbi:MAG: tRNA pseudouridine(38-40) synthase TruA, partial [Pseudomonas sp.]|nr:tRNA pseudouridine(38-40) synthase TruA [Pseudomonas sp.]